MHANATKTIAYYLCVGFLFYYPIQGINKSLYDANFNFETYKLKSSLLGVSEQRYPNKAVDFLMSEPFPRRMFNDFNSGAYLIGRTFPKRQVTIDGRTELYGPTFFKRYIEITSGKKEAVETIIAAKNRDKVEIINADEIKIGVPNISAKVFAQLCPSMSATQVRELNNIMDGLRGSGTFDVDKIISAVESAEMKENVSAPLLAWMHEIKAMDIFSESDYPGFDNLLKQGSATILDFKNVLDSTRVKVPFGIAQVGKAYRNEITMGQFVHRSFEFDLMEFEYFIKETDWEKTFDSFSDEMWQFALSLGLDEKKLRWREHEETERSHYSKKTADIEYEYPYGFKEMFGIAYRTNFDLTNHANNSGKDLSFIDPQTNEKFIPHCIEPSFGADRSTLGIGQAFSPSV